MANLPQSLSTSGASAVAKDRETAAAERIVHELILELSNPENRESALNELSKKRDLVQRMAPLIWNSIGTIAALLQEIVSVYPLLSPPNLAHAQSNRVCNALALLQYVASHPDTRLLFLKAHLHLYLHPFLKTTRNSKPFEYLRLTSLGVIGALVKADDQEIIGFLLSTEIIPLCLHNMEIGSVLSKTVSTFIIRKVLQHEVGKEYIFAKADRFFAIGQVLGKMVAFLVEQPSSTPASLVIRLLKHIIRCYLLLSDRKRGVEALRNCLPEMFRDGTFNNWLRDDPELFRWLQQLIQKVNVQQAGEGFNHMMMLAFRLEPKMTDDYCKYWNMFHQSSKEFPFSKEEKN